jgi:hypothetical protein
MPQELGTPARILTHAGRTFNKKGGADRGGADSKQVYDLPHRFLDQDSHHPPASK